MARAYEERFYRRWVTAADMIGFEVCIGETDLAIMADTDLTDAARDAVERLRGDIEAYIRQNGEFQASMKPVIVPDDAPEIVRRMALAGEAYGVGPMAAVAGAVAEGVGRALLVHSSRVVVENGGDIFMKTDGPRRVELYAGEESPFSRNVGLMVNSAEHGAGICASSGTVGHSTSFGRADAVVTIAADTAVADAAATAICNTVRGPDDIHPALDRERDRGRLTGLLIAIGDKLGAWGEIELA